ncbi:MAG: ornithine cyclodeaminase [Micavibrio sp.]|nr:ornithine cyclodeaminase [Micavibrio sp.]
MLYVDVAQMVKLIGKIGVETAIVELAEYIEQDFKRWGEFQKQPRYAAHHPKGVVELMPIADDQQFGFKYVNGHPANTKKGLQTVIAFGVLSDMETGYPLLLSEMTFGTALRTAATSSLAARYLARQEAQTMAIIGNGSQSEFQALGFKAMLGIKTIRVYDIDPDASQKLAQNLINKGLEIIICKTADEAILGADIITTVTADKKAATILSDNMVGAGVHINAIGGDCPGKTELHADVLKRGSVFVEYEPQTRIEGDIQQMSEDFAVTELWQVFASLQKGRVNNEQITIFDSVGFALEDFSFLRYIYDKICDSGYDVSLDLFAEPDNPRDLFGLL